MLGLKYELNWNESNQKLSGTELNTLCHNKIIQITLTLIEKLISTAQLWRCDSNEWYS